MSNVESVLKFIRKDSETFMKGYRGGQFIYREPLAEIALALFPPRTPHLKAGIFAGYLTMEATAELKDNKDE